MSGFLSVFAPQRTDIVSAVHITRVASRSDPSVLLISVFSPLIWRRTEPLYAPPRPRPSIQVYYTAPDAAYPMNLEWAARALESKIFADRHQGKHPDECDRLDVYGMPFTGNDSNLTNACIEHQRREIAARSGDMNWHIPRYDIGGCEWQRALVIVRKSHGQWWSNSDGSLQRIDLRVVYFNMEDHSKGHDEANYEEHITGSVRHQSMLIRELKARLNWQQSA